VINCDLETQTNKRDIVSAKHLSFKQRYTEVAGGQGSASDRAGELKSFPGSAVAESIDYLSDIFAGNDTQELYS